MSKRNGWSAKLAVTAVALIAAVLIAACGGSAGGWSGSQKTKARTELNSVFASYLSGVHLDAATTASLNAVKSCMLNTLESKFSPGSQVTTGKVNKVLGTACGRQFKAFSADAKAQVKAQHHGS